MIKQIQLRGISRSPSDRMSQDGGLDESLNLYIDSAENAPALMPEDVTASLGLPDDLQADKVFVHKTAIYENIITKEGDYVYAYVGQSKQQIVYEEGMNLNDIASVGNTLVLLTSQTSYYVLYREGEYNSLGTGIPLPKLTLRGVNATGIKEVSLDIDELGIYGMYRTFSPSLYNQYESDKTNSDEMVQKLLSAIYEQKALHMTELGKEGVFWGPIYVMYGVTLYDGSVVTSTPELLSRFTGAPPAQTWGLTLHSQYYTDSKEYVGGIDAKIDAPAFRLSVANSEEYDIAGWRDVVQSIDIYVSLPIDTAPNYKRIEILEVKATEDIMSDKTDVNASTIWGIPDEYEQITNKGVFYKVKSFNLEEFKEDVVTSIIWDSQGVDVTQGNLASSAEFLPRTGVDQAYADQTGVVGGKAIVYNDKVLLASAQVLYRYRGMSASYNQADSTYSARYKFILNDGSVVYSEDGLSIYQYGLILFPGLNATRMEAIVKRERRVYTDQDHTDYDIVTDYSFIKIPMSQHPSILCSYAYIGLQKNFAKYAFEKNGSMTLEVASGEVEFDEGNKMGNVISNKIFVSSTSNPFIYPETKRVTFQSKVLGVAIATTALSQGQFGQFPLYVFTEDGVWAMETAADGSFVTSKPLSRDVCINPDSITSIDNAVIFVTAKGVMLLQGSQVVNISPFMNGRHYAINESSRERIRRTEFADLIPVLEDSTPFMGFMKDASVAYDYQGKRLVFIKKDERYQYVYHMDTQTWHKVAYGTDLLAPINSYPECYVQGRELRHTILLYVDDAGGGSEQSYKDFVKAVRDNDIPLSSDDIYDMFYKGRNMTIDLLVTPEEQVQSFIKDAEENAQVSVTYDDIENVDRTRIYDLSTVLDGTREQETARGCIITRPMDFGYADVRKVINGIRIRGQYAKGAVSFMLLGSDDGETYHVLNSLRGRSWKLFRIIMLADLDRHERISWIDIDFETRFTNRLR